MAELSIRAPSVGELLDAWSDEPLARRPLNDEARRRIVEEWTRARKGAVGPPVVTLRLPEAERREGVEAAIAAAVRHDMETMAVDARRHWIRRSLRPRDSRLGILLFVVMLTIAAGIDWVNQGDSNTILSQAFVVLAWVAIWTPADRIITAAVFRLDRKYFNELAPAEVRVSWDSG